MLFFCHDSLNHFNDIQPTQLYHVIAKNNAYSGVFALQNIQNTHHVSVVIVHIKYIYP